MTIEDEIVRSRDLVQQHWATVADNCYDPRLHRATLQPVEGMTGHRSLDLDRRNHIDHFAATAFRGWIPLSTRIQDPQFAEYRTVTFRQTEVHYLRDLCRAAQLGRDDQLGATLHVHFYGDAQSLDLVIIAELGPIADHFAARSDDQLWWKEARSDGALFTCLSESKLKHIGAYVWSHDPTHPSLF